MKAAFLGNDREAAEALTSLLAVLDVSCDAPGTAPPAEPREGFTLVFFEEGLAGEGSEREFVEALGRGFPGALPVAIAPAGSQESPDRLFAAGVWDVVGQPLREGEVHEIVAGAAGLPRGRDDGTSGALLVVDDEESIRESCGEMLSVAGYTVAAAADGAAGLEAVRAGGVDLVISDIKMPGMDGIELLRRIREEAPDVPVVMLTGHATVDSAIEAMRQGAADYVRKPFKVDELLSIVKRTLSMQALSRENRLLQERTRRDRIALRRRAFELEVLSRFAGELVTLADPEGIASCFLDEASRLFGLRLGGVIILAPAPLLVVSAGDGPAGKAREAVLAAMLRAEPALAELIEATEVKAVHRKLPGGGGEEAAALDWWSASLEGVGGIAGAAAVGCPGQGAFSSRERSLLRGMAGQVSQALQKLAALQSQEKLQMEAMVSSMHHGIILSSVEGRILVMNEAARSLLCLKRREDPVDLAGLGAGRSVPLDGFVRELIASKEGSISRECYMKHPREMVLNLDLTLIRDGEGAVIGVVTLLRDITELKEIDRMKSEFVSIVSHEIRTPLTSIKNCTGIVLNRTAGDINEAQERFLTMAQVSIDRLTRLVNDLLDLSKIESGKMVLEIARVDLKELLEEVGLMTEHLAREKEVGISLRLPPEPVSVFGDADRLKQVFINLVQNAIKFSAEGSEVEIFLGRVDDESGLPLEAARKAAAAAGQVEVQVADRGAGIPEGDLEVIFDKFQQVEQTLRREMGGIGLGLPISRGIVESHGGAIWAEKRDGGGSLLRVVLPVDRRGDNVKEESI